MPTNSADGVKWDLTDLFSAHNDQRIDASLNECHARAETFATRFRPSFEQPETLTAAVLLDAMKELEIIYEALGRVGSYAGLLYAADTSNTSYQDLEQRVEQRSTESRNLLLFFEIQWLKVDDAAATRLIGDPSMKTYSHYLRSLRRYRPHTLTEPEEKVVNEKDNTGRNAFGRLFSEITSSLSFTLEKDGKQEELNLSQVLSLLHEPDRALRQRALDTLYHVLSRHGQVLTFVYDTLIQDHLTMDRLRHYADPIAQRHLFNEIDGEAGENDDGGAENNCGLAHDYFGPAKLLRLPRLALHDQYAPVGKEVRPFPYDQARQVILEAFEAFDPRVSPDRRGILRQEWIDAEVRKASAAAPSAPRLRRNCIRTFSATTTIICATDDRRPRARSRPARLLEPQAELFKL
jgi:oligoendopeptidase F